MNTQQPNTTKQHTHTHTQHKQLIWNTTHKHPQTWTHKNPNTKTEKQTTTQKDNTQTHHTNKHKNPIQQTT